MTARTAFRLTSVFLAIAFAVANVIGAAPKSRPPEMQAPIPSAPPTNGNGLNVLILGDSLALCGFGKRLDERFRNDPRVKATFTYMACGTNPLSWLKQKPYTSIKAQCGFWSIESLPNAAHPREMQDTYGMARHGSPKPHQVPKLEDLLGALHPDVLIMQSGSNLFGLFPDAKTVHTAQHGAALRNYLLPFKQRALSPPSTLRKIYWINPPVSGRVSKEVQDFLLEQARQQLNPPAVVIDSRPLVSYPYKHMDPDKEHFLGEDMTQWADRVYDLIDRDLNAQPLAALPPLAEVQTAAAPAATAAPAPAVQPQPVIVKAKLVFKSEPMSVQELMPYQESLVAYVYEVQKVVRGEYPERQILVMHPAHVALQPQRLDKFRIGKSYKLRLHPIEGTLWSTAKARDESGQINLQPYIKVEDLKRHPQNRTR